MTTTILLSAFNPEERKVLLSHLERSDLIEMSGRSGGSAMGWYVDFIAHNETLCSQTELTITAHVPL